MLQPRNSAGFPAWTRDRKTKDSSVRGAGPVLFEYIALGEFSFPSPPKKEKKTL
jgi:hypothetical protein